MDLNRIGEQLIVLAQVHPSQENKVLKKRSQTEEGLGANKLGEHCHSDYAVLHRASVPLFRIEH